MPPRARRSLEQLDFSSPGLHPHGRAVLQEGAAVKLQIDFSNARFPNQRKPTDFEIARRVSVETEDAVEKITRQKRKAEVSHVEESDETLIGKKRSNPFKEETK